MKNDFKPVVGHSFNLRGDLGRRARLRGAGHRAKQDAVLQLGFCHEDAAYNLKSVVTFTLTPTSTGTHLRVEQSGFQPEPEAGLWRRQGRVAAIPHQAGAGSGEDGLRSCRHNSTPMPCVQGGLPTTRNGERSMKIKLTSVYVDDQDKALRFYTEVLGFTKKADFSNGPFRWLTVTSPDEPEGTELQLALNDNPAGQGLPAGHLRAGPARAHAVHRRHQGRLRAHQGDAAARSPWRRPK